MKGKSTKIYTAVEIPSKSTCRESDGARTGRLFQAVTAVSMERTRLRHSRTLSSEV
jgi:hypothetical protein